MALPLQHLKKLKRQLRHHEIIIQLGTDPNLRRALTELYDDRDLRKKISNDPGGFLKQKGVRLPRGAKVSFREFSPRWRIEVGWNGHGAGYDSGEGFFCH